jgi:glutathione synthase/RimK-type ligase-like ATP-grasp enzyme
MRYYIQPYHPASEAARLLASSLRVLGERAVIRVDHNKRMDVPANRTLINWGSARVPVQRYDRIINSHAAVDRAGNKLRAFEALRGRVSIPEFTTDHDVAEEWLGELNIVLARHDLRGHSGAGIQIYDPTLIHGADEIQRFATAPLYVQYKKKKFEFRVHVFNGEVIDIQQKRRRADLEFPRDAINSRIRSHDNGWVFCRENISFGEAEDERTVLNSTAITAVQALGLDFGAVDIIYNEREDQFYVLEVNTAPGLEGQTLNTYVNAFRSLENAAA